MSRLGFVSFFPILPKKTIFFQRFVFYQNFSLLSQFGKHYFEPILSFMVISLRAASSSKSFVLIGLYVRILLYIVADCLTALYFTLMNIEPTDKIRPNIQSKFQFARARKRTFQEREQGLCFRIFEHVYTVIITFSFLSGQACSHSKFLDSICLLLYKKLI